MRAGWLLFAGLLAACGGPRAPVNPNSVPNVLLDITREREAGPAIYVKGGGLGAASVGQETTFVVTSDDRLLCVFQDAGNIGGNTAVATGYRQQVAGLYGAVAGAVLPNTVTREVEYLENFTVEAGDSAGRSMTTTGLGDPRFARLQAVFARYPSPCWDFG